MPQTIAVGNQALANFIKVMTLPAGERQKTFSNLSNEDKANVFKVQLALNFVKRPNLTDEQKSLIIESISTLSADAYNRENPELRAKAEKQAQELQTKSLAIFPPNEAHEIFASMNGDKSVDLELLKKYEEILSLTVSERKKIIRESLPADKSSFWKAQMIYHLATANFSNVQKSFIANVLPLITSNSFNFSKAEGQAKNEETKSLEAFTSTGFDLFSKDEFFVIFMGYGIHKPVFENTKKENSNLLSPACDCNYVCGWGETCSTSSCGVSSDGCGVFGGSECHYVCKNS